MKSIFSGISTIFLSMILSVAVVIVIVIFGVSIIFLKQTKWTDINSPSMAYNVSKNNEITLYLNLDDGSFKKYDTKLSISGKIAYIVYWTKVPGSITRKTGITSIDGYKTYKLEKNGGITFTFDKYYGGAEITVKAEGVRGKDYYPH